VADDDKTAPSERVILGGGTRRGLDQVVDVTPQADAMTPQDAVAAAEPPAEDARE